MSVKARCTNCLENFVIHERFRGRKIKCPHCQQETVVPSVANLSGKIEDSTLANVSDPAGVNTRKISVSVADLTNTPTNFGDAADITPEPPTRKRIPLKRSTSGGDHDLEWDITPMVDVVFLLLIFFMITASFTIQKVIRTPTQPSDKGAGRTMTSLDVMEEIKILVDDLNMYSVINIDGTLDYAGSKAQLVNMLNRMRGDLDPEMTKVTIEAHVDSNHGGVVGALDAAREAGFVRFKMTTVEEFSA